jgi:hypothetical protein
MTSWLTCDHGVDLSGARCRICEETNNPSGILPDEKVAEAVNRAYGLDKPWFHGKPGEQPSEKKLQSKLTVISDFHHVIAVVVLPKGSSIGRLRKEFEAIFFPGENPYAYDTPKQKEWLEKAKNREEAMVRKYGGSKSGDGNTYYGPETFVGWLVKEKGAKKIPFSDYTMAEFD